MKLTGHAGQIANRLIHVDLVILDELGYLPFSQIGGALLFHLLSKPYERSSVIITTNLSFGEQFGMEQSMSRKGNCWDNTPMESWFASLKKEQVHLTKYATREAAKSAIFDYVEVFYNLIRRHSKINNLSPTELKNNGTPSS